jgi:hypothetical protein
MAKSFSFEGRERVARDRVSEIGLTDTSQRSASFVIVPMRPTVIYPQRTGATHKVNGE